MVDLDAGYKIAQEMKRVSATDTSNDRFNINRENKMSDEILTVKKDNVLAAAKECAEAKRILAKVFPDAFEEEREWKEIISEISLAFVTEKSDHLSLVWIDKMVPFQVKLKDIYLWPMSQAHNLYDFEFKRGSIFARKK